MKSHYTIISAVVRPEIQEKISIGLLLVSANELFFMCSKNKLSAVRSLIDNSLYKFLNETIKQIDDAVGNENSHKNTLFESSEHNIQFSEGYISYMNRYSNNLINFSAPVQIDLPADDKLFDFLYSKYIDATGGPALKKTKSVEKVKDEFYPQIKTYYNTEKDVTRTEIPNLPMTVNVDIIGKNEIPVFGQLIDFERHLNFIQQDVAVLNFLTDAFEKDKSKCFMVGNEPDKATYPKSHDAWCDLRKWNKFIYLQLEEIEQIKDYAVEHGVVPLFN